MAQKLYRGQGKVFVAPVVAGIVGGGKFLGNVLSLSVNTEVEKLEHKESTSGKRAVDKTIITSRKASLTATLEDFSPDTMAITFQGAKTTIASGAVVSEVLPAGLVAGDYVSLAKASVSGLVITDSADPLPATLDADNFVIESAKHGSLRIIDVAGLTQPLVASYTYGAAVKADIMSGTQKTYELRFEGLNTAEDDQPVLVKLRVQLDPGKTLELIGDQLGSYEMAGDVLFHNGSFGEVIHL